jgi:hypothetical protein
VLAETLAKLHGSHAEAFASAVEQAVFAHVGEADALGDDVTLVVVARNA